MCVCLGVLIVHYTIVTTCTISTHKQIVYTIIEIRNGTVQVWPISCSLLYYDPYNYTCYITHSYTYDSST